MHVGGKPRKEHDKMILDHRDDHEHADFDFHLAIAKDEVIGMPRYPGSIKTDGKDNILNVTRNNDIQFVM